MMAALATAFYAMLLAWRVQEGYASNQLPNVDSDSRLENVNGTVVFTANDVNYTLTSPASDHVHVSMRELMETMTALREELTAVKADFRRLNASCVHRDELERVSTIMVNQTELSHLHHVMNESDVSLERMLQSQDASLEASHASLEGMVAGNLTELESALAAQTSNLEIITSDLGSQSNPAASCQALKQAVPDAPDGSYFLKVGEKTAFVYCLMDKADGGWTHVYTTAGETLASFHDQTTRSLCMDSTKQCYAGSSTIMPSVLPFATEWLLTDELFTPFMLQEFRIVGNYERSLRQACNSTNRYQARYPKGGLASLGWVPVEACTDLVTGLHDVSLLDALCDTAHACWMDVRESYRDRPFAYDHCRNDSEPSYCPAYDPAYSYPTTARRRGSMNYHAFLRFQESQLGSTSAFPGQSCEAIKARHVDSKNGHYYIRPAGSTVYKVFCLMDVEDGGWTLVLNTVGTGRERLNQDTRKELCWHPGQDCHSGVSSAVPDVMPTAKAILWTDIELTPMLFAEFIVPGQYWRGITTSVCDVNTTFVEVRYPKGPLSTLDSVNIEACTQFLWGTRGNSTVAVQLGECPGVHVCWNHVDASTNDQPFSGIHCPNINVSTPAYCPAYSPPYNFNGTTTGRNGDFSHSIFVRF
eukprot:TRINITY_DN12513_c0_g2_i6.p1 TRINITY_DN12513_c0_g2~~TRINITY_DN12513_c0_g2_i6.p1  ORF type:complete len:644 (+),score=87.29 TRINITY_DN12513_c0_g2_i6:132-2063(+)